MDIQILKFLELQFLIFPDIPTYFNFVRSCRWLHHAGIYLKVLLKNGAIYSNVMTADGVHRINIHTSLLCFIQSFGNLTNRKLTSITPNKIIEKKFHY